VTVYNDFPLLLEIGGDFPEGIQGNYLILDIRVAHLMLRLYRRKYKRKRRPDVNRSARDSLSKSLVGRNHLATPPPTAWITEGSRGDIPASAIAVAFVILIVPEHVDWTKVPIFTAKMEKKAYRAPAVNHEKGTELRDTNLGLVTKLSQDRGIVKRLGDLVDDKYSGLRRFDSQTQELGQEVGSEMVTAGWAGICRVRRNERIMALSFRLKAASSLTST